MYLDRGIFSATGQLGLSCSSLMALAMSLNACTKPLPRSLMLSSVSQFSLSWQETWRWKNDISAFCSQEVEEQGTQPSQICGQQQGTRRARGQGLGLMALRDLLHVPWDNCGCCDGAHASRTQPFPNAGTPPGMHPLSCSSQCRRLRHHCSGHQRLGGSPSLPLSSSVQPSHHLNPGEGQGLGDAEDGGDVQSHQLMALQLPWPQGCFRRLILSPAVPSAHHHQTQCRLAGLPALKCGVSQGQQSPKVPVRQQGGSRGFPSCLELSLKLLLSHVNQL